MEEKSKVSVGAVTYSTFDRQFFDASTEWLANEELRRMTMARETSFDERVAWFESIPHREDFIIRGIAVDGQPVGCFGFRNVDRINRRAEYWSQIGDPAYWGKGLSKWMMAEGVRIAHKEGIEEVYMKVASYNERAMRASRRDGFEARNETDGVVEFAAGIKELLKLHGSMA